MLAAEHQQTLVAFAFENLYFFGDLLHRQRDTVEFLIVAAKSAIQAVVGAEIGNIKRRE